MLIAIAAGATFVARAFSGNTEHLTKIMKAAIAHKGYALVDILQPCVTFNKVNTYAYYKERVYEPDSTYDCTDKIKALEKSMECDTKIPIGIIYEENAKSYEAKRPALFDGTAVIDKSINTEMLEELINKYI